MQFSDESWRDHAREFFGFLDLRHDNQLAGSLQGLFGVFVTKNTLVFSSIAQLGKGNSNATCRIPRIVFKARIFLIEANFLVILVPSDFQVFAVAVDATNEAGIASFDAGRGVQMNGKFKLIVLRS